MNVQLSNTIKGNYRTLLDNTPIVARDFEVSYIMENANNLCRNVTSAFQYISEDDIYSRLVYDLVHILKNVTLSDDTGGLRDLVGSKIIEQYADNFLSFLNGLPYDYQVLFPTSIKLPLGTDRVVLSQNVEIITVRLPANEIRYHSDIASSLKFETKDIYKPSALIDLIGSSFISIRSKGYIFYGGLDESGIREASLKLRQFLYIGLSLSALWHRPASARSRSDKRRAHSVIQKNRLIAFDIVPNFEDFLSSLFVSNSSCRNVGLLSDGAEPDSISEKVENLKRKLKPATSFLDRDVNDLGGIDRAIDWAMEGIINKNHENGFIQTCIALEVILGGNVEEGISITKRLADRGSYLLSQNRLERESIYDNITKIYKLRSKIVHGQGNLQADDRALVALAEEYVRKCIMAEISNLPEVTD